MGRKLADFTALLYQRERSTPTHVGADNVGRSYSSAQRKLRPLMALAIGEFALDAKEYPLRALGFGLYTPEGGAGDDRVQAFISRHTS